MWQRNQKPVWREKERKHNLISRWEHFQVKISEQLLGAQQGRKHSFTNKNAKKVAEDEVPFVNVKAGQKSYGQICSTIKSVVAADGCIGDQPDLWKEETTAVVCDWLQETFPSSALFAQRKMPTG